MRASDLIRELQVEIDAHGDREVFASCVDFNVPVQPPITEVKFKFDAIVLETE